MLSEYFLGLGRRNGVLATSKTFRVDDAVARANRNVHAVGIGRKRAGGTVDAALAVRFYVVQKIAPSLIAPQDRLPASLDGIPTDVIESSPAFLLPRARAGLPAAPAAAPGDPPCSRDRLARQRPLVAGISVAHHAVTAGTLGYFCRSLRPADDPGLIYILSNNHVLANVNQGAPGDAVYQPGPADGGLAGDRIAALARFVPIDLSGGSNGVDAAVAALMPAVDWTPEICTIGAIARTARGAEGLAVRKHGRTTGYTEGTIADESYDAIVGMDHNHPQVVGLFKNQLRVEPSPSYPAIGLAGDSGSLVVNRNEPEAVGLYFAGPPDGSYGIANPIDAVLSSLEVALVTPAGDPHVA
ncbi:hypothetical protein [Methylobacterium crusticola]|nr:hypothetical protein [Methylobacterium crusticola]